eukprot:15998945-Heterocapsa_arctica.AAC.1
MPARALFWHLEGAPELSNGFFPPSPHHTTLTASPPVGMISAVRHAAGVCNTALLQRRSFGPLLVHFRSTFHLRSFSACSF